MATAAKMNTRTMLAANNARHASITQADICRLFYCLKTFS
ncbi:hypothetical protein BN132_3518 [Cronobacter turicensis 564]|nr:hypothetical protein BN132_3518 [Cronobacter turicensis 564]